jgi:hypothetical protein
MTQTQVLARSLNDVGLAAWFGGSLMGAAGLNEAAAREVDNDQTTAVASVGWSRWTPINAAAIGAHLAGAALLVFGNKGRVAGQRGVGTAAVVKVGLTAAALGVTGYARLLGKRIEGDPTQPAAGGVEPVAGTAPEVARAQRQLHLLQWAIPALTGGMLVCDAVLGEQQRPTKVLAGIVGRLTPG